MGRTVKMEMEIEIKLSFTAVKAYVRQIGQDYIILLEGGDSPHIGCAVMAVPRPSLTGDGSMGSTASVLNLTGHKDEEVCRYLAEQVAKKKGAVTVCTGGIHVENITSEQITEIMNAVKQIEVKI